MSVELEAGQQVRMKTGTGRRPIMRLKELLMMQTTGTSHIVGWGRRYCSDFGKWCATISISIVRQLQGANICGGRFI